MFRTLAIATALVGIISTAYADVYRSTDAQGHVQYSDRWVPGSTLIKSTTPRNTTSTPAPDQQDKQVAASNARIDEQLAQEEAERKVKQDVAANKAQQCKEATEAYDKAVRARRIIRAGKEAEREYLSEEEADAYRTQLLMRRREVCGE